MVLSLGGRDDVEFKKMHAHTVTNVIVSSICYTQLIHAPLKYMRHIYSESIII